MKRKRNFRSGRYERDYTFRNLMFGGIIIGLVFGIPYATGRQAYYMLKNAKNVFIVENAGAAEPIHITWQDEVKAMIRDAGLDVELADRIIQRESWWNPKNTHINPDGTRDRGLWMFHEKYHAEISDSCAYDPICSTKAAIKIIKTRGWQEWVAYRYVK